MKKLKLHRNSDKVNEALSEITDASTKAVNLLPFIIDAAKTYATLGEIVDSMKIVFGEWKESPVIWQNILLEYLE